MVLFSVASVASCLPEVILSHCQNSHLLDKKSVYIQTSKLAQGTADASRHESIWHANM